MIAEVSSYKMSHSVIAEQGQTEQHDYFKGYCIKDF